MKNRQIDGYTLDARSRLCLHVYRRKCLLSLPAVIWYGKVWTNFFFSWNEVMNVPDILCCLKGNTCGWKWLADQEMSADGVEFMQRVTADIVGLNSPADSFQYFFLKTHGNHHQHASWQICGNGSRECQEDTYSVLQNQIFYNREQIKQILFVNLASHKLLLSKPRKMTRGNENVPKNPPL